MFLPSFERAVGGKQRYHLILNSPHRLVSHQPLQSPSSIYVYEHWHQRTHRRSHYAIRGVVEAEPFWRSLFVDSFIHARFRSSYVARKETETFVGR